MGSDLFECLHLHPNKRVELTFRNPCPLGVCEGFNRKWDEHVLRYECEWKKVVDTPGLWKKFKQFVNVPGKKHGGLEWETVRKQKKIQVEDLPTVIGPAKITKEKADDRWIWIDVGATEDFPKTLVVS